MSAQDLNQTSRKNSHAPLKFLCGVFIVWLCVNLIRAISAQQVVSAKVVLVILGGVALLCVLLFLISRQQYHTWRHRYEILHAEHSRLQVELKGIHDDSWHQIAKLHSTLAERNALIQKLEVRISDLEHRVALFDEEVERITRQKLRDLLDADHDHLVDMYNSFLGVRERLTDYLVQAAERLLFSEELFEHLHRLLQAQRRMMVEIEGDDQEGLKLTVPLPEDPHEFFGIVPESETQELPGRRRHLLKLFHPDKCFDLKIAWVTQLFTTITEVINKNYNELNPS
jgi:hypothetical protein